MVDHARVRRVLEAKAEEVLAKPAREVRTEAAVEHPPRALLGDVLRRPDEAVPVVDLAVREFEARDHSVAVERVIVLRAVGFHLARAVAIEHAAERGRERALRRPETDIELVAHRFVAAEVGGERVERDRGIARDLEHGPGCRAGRAERRGAARCHARKRPGLPGLRVDGALRGEAAGSAPVRAGAVARHPLGVRRQARSSWNRW